jgi:phage shock protein A
MNRSLAAATVALALLGAGCANYVTFQEHQELSDRLDKFSAQAAQKNDMQALLYDEIVKQNKALAEKMARVESLSGALESSVKRLEDQIRTLQVQFDALSQGTEPARPAGAADPAPPSLRLEDVLREIEITLSELRNGKLKQAEAAARLKLHGDHAAPKVVAEIQTHFANLDYSRQLEGILAALPAAVLKVPLQTALGLRTTRESAVRVVGVVGDKDLSLLLEPLMGDPDEDFRLAVGEALVRCRNAAGIPLLVGSLRSAQGATRLIAISALKRVNRGEDLGFRPHADGDQNDASLRAWEEWAAKFGKAIFD